MGSHIKKELSIEYHHKKGLPKGQPFLVMMLFRYYIIFSRRTSLFSPL